MNIRSNGAKISKKEETRKRLRYFFSKKERFYFWLSSIFIIFAPYLSKYRFSKNE